MSEWAAMETAPKDGHEFMIRYPHQGNVKELCRWDVIHKQWDSKGKSIFPDTQGCEWICVETLRAQLKARDLDLADNRAKALQWGDHAKESQKAAREIETKLTSSQEEVRAMAAVCEKKNEALGQLFNCLGTGRHPKGQIWHEKRGWEDCPHMGNARRILSLSIDVQKIVEDWKREVEAGVWRIVKARSKLIGDKSAIEYAEKQIVAARGKEERG